MAELGNILEPDATAGGPRGPDLSVEVRVPRAALGDPDGYPVEIPRRLASAGGYVERVVSPHDEGETVVLRLPEGFPSGGTLKLRGQGGVAPETDADDDDDDDGAGRPGDLLVKIELTGGPLARRDPTDLAGQMPRWMPLAGLIALVASLVAWALL